ncbi:MAG: hypothetical protein HOB78_08595 [Flavobacteriales bacterium]|nr:hypothetical protein [Flavobacteriales bacterium]
MISCPHCSKKFKTKITWLKHMKKVHS